MGTFIFRGSGAGERFVAACGGDSGRRCWRSWRIFCWEDFGAAGLRRDVKLGPASRQILSYYEYFPSPIAVLVAGNCTDAAGAACSQKAGLTKLLSVSKFFTETGRVGGGLVVAQHIEARQRGIPVERKANSWRKPYWCRRRCWRGELDLLRRVHGKRRWTAVLLNETPQGEFEERL